MAKELTASESRAPTNPSVAGVKITAANTAAGTLIGMMFPHLEISIVLLLGGAAAGISAAIGKEIRNYQHTFEPGGKREAEVQGGLAEILLGFLGSIL